MEIQKLIERLGLVAEYLDQYKMHGKADVCLKAAEVIKLLWEIARDTNNEKWRRKIDEMEGNDDLCPSNRNPHA